jgi:ribosomal subunit interface protein
MLVRVLKRSNQWGITMHIEIQARDFPLTEALHGYVERRLRFALSARDDAIMRVQVRLSDVNGPRGGEDKCCQVRVLLPGLGSVVIEDTESDLYVAIDRAADRTSRTVSRKLGRLRNRSRAASAGRRHLHANLEQTGHLS